MAVTNQTGSVPDLPEGIFRLTQRSFLLDSSKSSLLTHSQAYFYRCRSICGVLDDALDELAKLDPQQSRIVELRFFGGLSIEETSHVLGISPATVKRDWTMARVWRHNEISKAEAHDP